MNVRWTPEAVRDRTDIWDHVAQDDPLAAARLDTLFSQTVARLADHPELGRQGMIHGTREIIPHQSYRLVYEIRHETVWILALVHSARQWPPVERH